MIRKVAAMTTFSNYLKFNECFFEFPTKVGIPIASPLGSPISEIFMAKFENDLFTSSSDLLDHVVYWHRYIDEEKVLDASDIPVP